MQGCNLQHSSSAVFARASASHCAARCRRGVGKTREVRANGGIAAIAAPHAICGKVEHLKF